MRKTLSSCMFPGICPLSLLVMPFPSSKATKIYNSFLHNHLTCSIRKIWITVPLYNVPTRRCFTITKGNMWQSQIFIQQYEGKGTISTGVSTTL
jgi:hypothetical protein